MDVQIGFRLQQLLDSENLSQREFAELCGIKPTEISGIINGSRNLGIIYVRKMLKAIPDLNLNWLITGEGPVKNKHICIEDQIGVVADSGENKYEIDHFEMLFLKYINSETVLEQLSIIIDRRIDKKFPQTSH